MSDRSTFNSEDRVLQEEISRSTKVSSYLDGVYEAITTGDISAAKAQVPNYGTGRTQNSSFAHETGGIPMNMQGLFLASANALGEDGISHAMQNTLQAREQGDPTFKNAAQGQQNMPRAAARISENQFRAIKKYPSVVEFLGTEYGAKIANQIFSEMNTLLADQIQKNTQLVHDNAKMCVAQKQYLHHFFQGTGWACKVTANGPFRGDEAFYYKEDEDKCFILRRIGSRYEDVSREFNITHDYRTVDENAADTD